MARIGRLPIRLDGVAAKLDGRLLTVKGKRGELSRKLPEGALIELGDGEIVVKPDKRHKEWNARWGLVRALAANMVEGVREGFSKTLEIQGVGYRAEVRGKSLVMALGYSHQVEFPLPEGLEVQVEGNKVIVKGADREKVGQFAAKIRQARPAEPYKGKGVRYLGEHIRRKAGKAGKAGAK